MFIRLQGSLLILIAFAVKEALIESSLHPEGINEERSALKDTLR
jgi:hypothetical protein